MSLPVFNVVCSPFVSYLVQLVSLLCVYSVSLVVCELLNVMDECLPIILFFVRYGFCFIVCSSFSIKLQLLHNVSDFDWHVSLTRASLSLCLL